jgi:hypothetical protein
LEKFLFRKIVMVSSDNASLLDGNSHSSKVANYQQIRTQQRHQTEEEFDEELSKVNASSARLKFFHLGCAIWCLAGLTLSIIAALKMNPIESKSLCPDFPSTFIYITLCVMPILLLLTYLGNKWNTLSLYTITTTIKSGQGLLPPVNENENEYEYEDSEYEDLDYEDKEKCCCGCRYAYNPNPNANAMIPPTQSAALSRQLYYTKFLGTYYNIQSSIRLYVVMVRTCIFA